MLLSSIHAAFFFTVVLLIATAYFLMGGLPLLILKHDVPLDARFVRGFFNVYYRVAFWASLGACVSFAVWGQYAFVAGAAANVAATVALKRYLLLAMAQLGARIEASDTAAIGHFRRMHGVALMVNLLQLTAIVWGVLRLSQQLR